MMARMWVRGQKKNIEVKVLSLILTPNMVAQAILESDSMYKPGETLTLLCASEWGPAME